MSQFKVRLMPSPDGTDNFAEYDSYEEACARADKDALYGGCVLDSLGYPVYYPYGEVGSQMLYFGKKSADHVRRDNFVYGHAPINPVYNHNARTVSCDRFVDWVLFEAGYVDQHIKYGMCVSSPGMDNWCAPRSEIIKIEKEEDLLPGDLICSKEGPGGHPYHIFVHAGFAEDGKAYRYDCGCRNRIRCANDEGYGADYSEYAEIGQPFCEKIQRFMYAYRLPKIKKRVAPRLSFTYDGVPFSELECAARCDDLYSITYTLPDGVELTTRYEFFPKYGVMKWTNYWNNPTDHKSGLISNLRDCDVTFDMAADPKIDRRHRQSTWEPKTLRLCLTDDASCKDSDHFHTEKRMWAGDKHDERCAEGRSGLGRAPFFDVVSGDNSNGVLFAVGWTGQWNAHFERGVDDFSFSCGIEDVNLRMEPGEKFRTASVTVLPYNDGQTNAHNRWRRYIREVISPFAEGKNNAGEQSPFSAIFWGGVSSEQLMRRWKGIFDAKLPFNYCWVDAGWYEPLCGSTTAEQSAEWPKVGTWDVSKHFHPDGYRDVVKYLGENGVKFLLWFEPERFYRNIAEWTDFLWVNSPDENVVLAALNKDEVCDQIIEKISSCIKDMSISCYRQDCNILPLKYWRANDARQENGDERRGSTEIHYINNLWRFWDTLLERFPSLLIDNCAGGGHRIDIEMLSRSVPLWRSDYQCVWDCCPEANQNQNAGAAWWYPYSGIGYGPTLGDTYSFRSAYTNGMTVRTWEHVDPEWEVGAMGEPLDWAKKYFEEYNSIRHYFSEDFYPLIPSSKENTAWSSSQYHKPDDDTGIILSFRRARCPYDRANVTLGGIDESASYEFTNVDTGESFTLDGATLARDGLTLVIPEQRQSQILCYKKI